MKTEFQYPAEKEDLSAFRVAHPDNLVQWQGSTVTVLTGDDLAAHNADRAAKKITIPSRAI